MEIFNKHRGYFQDTIMPLSKLPNLTKYLCETNGIDCY